MPEFTECKNLGDFNNRVKGQYRRDLRKLPGYTEPDNRTIQQTSGQYKRPPPSESLTLGTRRSSTRARLLSSQVPNTRASGPSSRSRPTSSQPPTNKAVYARPRHSSSQALDSANPGSNCLNDGNMERMIVFVMRDAATNVAEVINQLKPHRHDRVTARDVAEVYSGLMSAAGDYWYGETAQIQEGENERMTLRDFRRNLQTLREFGPRFRVSGGGLLEPVGEDKQ